MCNKKIGSGGGHKISRVNEGARRLMTDKMIDRSAYYVYKMT